MTSSSSNQLAQDFAFFIHHSTDSRTLTTPANIERTCSICLNLLTTFPSAREAIFDYFNSLISIGVHCFIQNVSLVASVSDLLITIESKLTSLAMQSNSWANILAHWSIDQLFDLTVRFANEANIKKCETLEDRIQLWTQCQAAMTLIKICSACILHDSTAADNALNKYLGASILSRPSFDWVTVSLTLRCGQTLISRLIQLSLQETNQSQIVHGVRRIYAVWSSLEVIAEQEPQIFSQVLMEQIQSLLISDDIQKHVSIISLIQMIFVVVTGPLCDIVYYSLYRSLNTLSLRRLCSSIRQTNTIDIEQLTNEFISGLMRIRTDAFQIIQFILSFIHDEISTDPDEIELTLRNCCKYVLQQLCHECHCKFRLHKDNQKPTIPILSALRTSFDHLLDLLNYTKSSEKIHLINDLCFNVALYNGDDTMIKYIQYIFTNKTSLDILQDIHLEFEYYHPNCLHDALNLIFEQNNSSKISICLENLLQLVLVDERPSLSNNHSIQSIIWSLIDHFSRLLSENCLHYDIILQIFLQLKCYEILPTYEQILQIASSFTDIHIKIIEDNENNLIENLLLWRDTLLNFIHFNNYDFHLFVIITLMDFLIPKLSPFDKVDDTNLTRRPIDNSGSLLEQNVNFNALNSNRVLSRSFRKTLTNDRFIKIPPEYIDQYTMLMTDVFNELIYNDNSQKQQLLICLVTTLIDNILPDSTVDVQFDDDQCKTPNERNLALIRRLDEQPLVWILLEIIATDNNAFQLCLPIIRCLLSALIVQWENVRGEDRATTYLKQLTLSTNLIILLKKARYLPLPLNEIYELFPFVTCYDCFTLLSNIWNYLKQNQQLLTTKLLTQQQTIIRDPLYFDPIRFVIQKNIANVGHIAEHFLHLQLQPTGSIAFISDDERKALTTFVIVGGGPTSIEFSGELHDFIVEDVAKWFPDVKTRVIVVESTDHILGTFDSKLTDYAMNILKSRSEITLKTNTHVKRVDENEVLLSNGEVIPCGLTVWSTGLSPTELTSTLSFLKEKRSGRIYTNDHLQVLIDDKTTINNIFALGDCATPIEHSIPATAQAAAQQAKYLAKRFNQKQFYLANSNEISNDKYPAFNFSNLGMLAYLGGYGGLADLKQTKISGFLSWLLWRSVYMTRLVSFKNRLLVAMFWFKSFVFGRDISRF
ncbi:unnamed protein product [Adineta steineri]|uniref:FAD/NAD(P)-binding domain-containing protein n=1 Tax=Adineta steineri TaxID=433720 RepID=A0A813TI16_9BILA|nr:unnamed protein product [Adineta steineri]CAF0814837.1 unnamed protein product [Adineta steineri]